MLRRLIRELLGTHHYPVRQLTPEQEKIYNEGERLIPGVTHQITEVVRHKSSYDFFRAVIEDDMLTVPTIRQADRLTIADLGSGTGHGCFMLARIRNSAVTGIDNSPDCLAYAREHYFAANIAYELADLTQYAKDMPRFDYVVSRGVFEHVPDGLRVAFATKWRYRLLFDVPYDEAPGPNPHHVLTAIREEHFSRLAAGSANMELFYQDLAGVVFDQARKPQKPNMIMCICSHPDLPPVMSKKLQFPFPAWRL